MPTVSIIMPTYLNEAFIRRSVDSLLAQSLADWELLIIDDGSPDRTTTIVQGYLLDTRIRYYRLDENCGLGAAVNFGLGKARSPLIAYLPSDDVIYRDHLATLKEALDRNPKAVLAYSGVRHHYNRTSLEAPPNISLQMVQVMHRSMPNRWVERSELVTDNLNHMYWDQLRSRGEFTATKQVTCEWVDHPDQLHKIIREPVGGINLYRQRFGVKEPLRFHSTVGNFIDEDEHYRRFRERPDTPPAEDGLKILLVGELAYNPERVLALEERGHTLYGLWIQQPYWYNMVGPLPFGHVTDLPRENWQEAVRKLQPDVIYALLNWQAVPFAHQVMRANPGLPFVWHFKEGPFICLEKGTWKEMVDLYVESDGQIYSSPEMQTWFETIIPELAGRDTAFLLDGDLPKKDWLTGERSSRLSETDGEIHTVVPGAPIGLHPQTVVELAEQGIHLHFYGDFTHGQWLEWIEKTLRLAPSYMHLHRQVDQEGWVKEFSKYDAGWLHFFQSENGGEIRRANWDDLNFPARISTLVAAGLPLLQRSNPGAIVAAQNLASSLDIGLFFTNMKELRSKFDDPARMQELRDNVWRQRSLFTFDQHVQALTEFFYKIIRKKSAEKMVSQGSYGFSVEIASTVRLEQGKQEQESTTLAGTPGTYTAPGTYSGETRSGD
jgi:glycosyltransferase involved in cell wall biosynthesis